jgi:hypothetical protein
MHLNLSFFIKSKNNFQKNTLENYMSSNLSFFIKSKNNFQKNTLETCMSLTYYLTVTKTKKNAVFFAFFKALCTQLFIIKV